MPRSVSWLLCLLLFGVFGVAVAFVLRERIAAGKNLPPFSVYNDEANGLAEAAYLLSKLGYQPVAVTRQLQTNRQHGLLILVEPHQGGVFPGDTDALADAEAKAVLRWVASGNTLLLSSRRTTALHRLLHVAVVAPSADAAEAPALAEVSEAGGYTQQVETISADRYYYLQTRDGLPLWEQKGEPGAVLLGHGQGRVLLVADPTLLTARGLGRADNLLFLVNVARLDARDGIVYFDEYHHGFRSMGGFWGYLGYHGQQLALLPLFLVLALAAWHVLIRLGPATPTPPETQADAVDYASALARLYQKAGVRRLLGKTLTRGFLTALTAHLKLRKTALPAEILAAWRPANEKDGSAERLKRLLKGVGELRKGDVRERDLLQWAREFDQFITDSGIA